MCFIGDLAVCPYILEYLSHICTCTDTNTPIIPDTDVCTKDDVSPSQSTACCVPYVNGTAMEMEGANCMKHTSCQVILLLESSGNSVSEQWKVRQRKTGVIRIPLHMASSRKSVAAVLQEWWNRISGMFTLAMCELHSVDF